MGEDLDVAAARQRLEEAAEEAKALEERGEGIAAHEAWQRYQLIADAIEAHDRRARIATD